MVKGVVRPGPILDALPGDVTGLSPWMIQVYSNGILLRKIKPIFIKFKVCSQG